MSFAIATKKDLANKANGSYDKTVKYRLLSGGEFVFSEEDVKKPNEPQKSIRKAMGCELQEVRIVGNDIVITSKAKKGQNKGRRNIADKNKDPTDEELEEFADWENKRCFSDEDEIIMERMLVDDLAFTGGKFDSRIILKWRRLSASHSKVVSLTFAEFQRIVLRNDASRNAIECNL